MSIKKTSNRIGLECKKQNDFESLKDVFFDILINHIILKRKYSRANYSQFTNMGESL